MIEEPYGDRAEAGRVLAAELSAYAGRDDVVVLALPRGGVPVACEVARTLGAALDVLVVRKIGIPWQPELAAGAIAGGGIEFLDRDLMKRLGLSRDQLAPVIEQEWHELERRELLYRGARRPPMLAGRTVILVDDGLATGATMRAAVAAVREQGPARVVVAVPVAPPSSCEILEREADQVVCPLRPQELYAVGVWYRDFTQLTDRQVRDLLRRAAPPQNNPIPHEVSP